MKRKAGTYAFVIQAGLLAIMLSACSHSSDSNGPAPLALPSGTSAQAVPSASPSDPRQAVEKPGAVAGLPTEVPALPGEEGDGEPQTAETNGGTPPKQEEPAPTGSESDATASSMESPTREETVQAPNALPEREWDPNAPRLAGIRLGDTADAVAARLGSVRDEYDVPDENDTIHMKDYSGVTVGFGNDGRAVYIELTDDSAASGIKGLDLGGSGRAAAEALGLTLAPEDLLLLLEVQGGLVKIDLDPSSRQTLSVKLIGQS